MSSLDANDTFVEVLSPRVPGFKSGYAEYRYRCCIQLNIYLTFKMINLKIAPKRQCEDHCGDAFNLLGGNYRYLDHI